jgi:hypothetical protein
MKSAFGTPVADYIPAAALEVVTIIFLASAYTYPAEARAFPAVIGWVVMVLAALDIVSRSDTGPGRALSNALNPGSAAAAEAYSLRDQSTAMLWLAALAALLMALGVLLAIPLYLFASLYFRGRKSLITSLWISVAATGGIWVLFAVVLRVELYRGYFFGGA